MYHLFFN